MGRSQKTKKISWASDVNLCQVRLFLSEESPSRVVLGTQDHLQEKASWALQSGDNESGDNLPPGFERIQPANLWRVNLSRVPLIKWRRPLRFEVNIEWQVVAGEESKEVEAQNQREMRVLEAIYPRSSSIPPNPSGLVNVENSIAIDENTPVVPVTPIEDDDAALDTSFNFPTPNPNPVILQPQISSHSTNSHAHSNTLAALTSALSNKDQANLVDPDLLIKILSDPKMIEQLVKNQGVSSSSAQNVPSMGMQKSTSFGALNKPFNMPYIPPISTPPTNNAACRIEHCAPSIFHPNPQIRTTPTSPSLGAPMKKDINYCKTLIQQHGRERQDGSQHLNSVKSRESKPKILKPCIYFNSPKGCRNGANCAYQHDRVNGFPEVQNAKRLKLDGGITGR